MSNSVLDPHRTTICEWIKMGKNNTEVVDLLSDAFDLEVSEATVRRVIKRHPSLQEAAEERAEKQVSASYGEGKAESELTTESDDELSIVSFVKTNVALTEDDMIRIYKVDLERWIAHDFKINSWPGPIGDGAVTRYYQTTLRFKPRVQIAQIVVPGAAVQIPAPPKAYKKLYKSFLWVGLYDAHAPYYERGLFELTRQWLSHNRPERGLFGGDGVDYSSISQHPNSLVYAATVNECNRSWFEFLLGVTQASRETQFDYLDGNHDDRIKKSLLAMSPELASITSPHWPDEEKDERPIWHPAKLFDLDRLGVKYHGWNGPYGYGRVRITDNLVAMHGNFTGPNAKQKTAEKYNCNVIFGHLHQYGVHVETRWNVDTGDENQIQIIQAPTMAQTSEGLGYDTAPNWSRGFVTVRILKPGVYTHSYAAFKDGVLTWEDQEYSL